MNLSKEKYYKFFVAHTCNPVRNSEILWTLLPTHGERAVVYARKMLKYYQERNDMQAISDMEWIITKIEKEII